MPSVSQERYHLNIRKIPWYCWWLVCWRMSIMVHTMQLICLRDMLDIQRAGSNLVILPYFIYPPSTLRSLHVFILLHVAIFQTLKVAFQEKKQPGPKVYLCDVLICSEKSGSIPNVCCCWFHCQMFPSFLADFLRTPRAIPSPSRSSCGSADGQSSAMPSGSTVPHRVSNRMKISRTRMS